LYFNWVPFSPRQAVELFHLVFLRALVSKGDDKSLFALKGGCNLRFYFDSIRYSEDIDIDVVVVAKETLKNKVERLLASPLVRSPLLAKGIEIVDVSSPKQTETTQRWKAGLRTEGSPVVRTKIEFSRRDAAAGTAFEPIGRAVLLPYAMTPFLAPHYTTSAAITQKLRALAGRTEPQARDVFDLNLLFARPDASGLDSSDLEAVSLTAAIDRAMSISFDDYASTVLAYLEPSQAEPYRSRTDWELMQDTVVARLTELAEQQ
jgi:hypothetical protein